ncbi:phenylacetate--CoA ligase family protein [Actinomadura harenae]|nr:hypothetical protein [Actinomadura harenae]
MRSHLRAIQAAQAGSDELHRIQWDKLVSTVGSAASAPLATEPLRRSRELTPSAVPAGVSPRQAIRDLLSALPLLERSVLRARPNAALNIPPSRFVHYYESSGTTGDPVAAPKAVDDLVVNTMNIGEMWGRFLVPGDVALILINGPFAPAGYQFEKVLEYLGVMSARLWTDNVTGDYGRILAIVREIEANVYVGTASRLLEMTQFALDHAEPVPRFARLLLMAEQTGPHLLRHLEELTGSVALVCSYGSSETGTVAVTCERGRLHLQSQSYLAEIGDDSGIRLIDGGPDRGELVVTTLDLPSRPLVRYRTGDLVEITGERCRCGSAQPVVRTLGREQDVFALGDLHVRQGDVEALLWPSDVAVGEGPRPLNYMLVLRGRHVVCLITTDRPASTSWCAALQRRLAEMFSARTFALRVVESLPPLATQGAYVGWKLSRVLDLDDTTLWDRLPAPIRGVLQETLQTLDAIPDMPSVTARDVPRPRTEPAGTPMAAQGTMTAEQQAQFVLGVYFRTQAAIERYMGADRLPQWTQHVAEINAAAMRRQLPDRAAQARDLLTGLNSMLDVYGSDTTRVDEADRTVLEVRRCGIYDYRERAREQGVQLTLGRPCEYCVDLHHRTAAELGISVRNELGERNCRWVTDVPVTGAPTGGDPTGVESAADTAHGTQDERGEQER